jgi:retron-type reverse transcriptase
MKLDNTVGLGKMQTSLERIANKARTVKNHRFQNLYRELNVELLHQSWKKLNKKSAAGVDKVSYQDYDSNKEGNIIDLVERLKEKRYKAKLVKRKEILKANGKVRPLGIPATEDKLLQYAAKEILYAVFEGDFLESSYGYRHGRGARDAVEAVQRVAANKIVILTGESPVLAIYLFQPSRYIRHAGW